MWRGIALVCAVTLWGPSSGRGDGPAEITLKRTSKDFLFFRGDYYHPGGEIPHDETLDPQAEQTTLTGFSATVRAGKNGTVDIPALRFECQGTRYVLPSHQIIVLESHQQEQGLFVESRLDPNGSGNVEVVISYRTIGEKNDPSVYLDYSKRPEKLEVFNQGSSSSRGNNESSWKFKVVLRNKSDEPFIVTPELFKNLPEMKNWPRIEVPPASADDENP